MIRIVGYVVPDASMTQAESSRWFTIWEQPPQLSASSALKQASGRMATWEKRLKVGSYNGVTRVAVEVDVGNEGRVVALDVRSGWGGK